MFKELTKKVYKVLKEYPQTRDCDTLLKTVLYVEYYPDCVVQHTLPIKKGRINIEDLKGIYISPYDEKFNLPSLESIGRARRYVQYKMKEFLPEDKKVQSRRQWNFKFLTKFFSKHK